MLHVVSSNYYKQAFWRLDKQHDIFFFKFIIKNVYTLSCTLDIF